MKKCIFSALIVSFLISPTANAISENMTDEEILNMLQAQKKYPAEIFIRSPEIRKNMQNEKNKINEDTKKIENKMHELNKQTKEDLSTAKKETKKTYDEAGSKLQDKGKDITKTIDNDIKSVDKLPKKIESDIE